MIGITWHPFAAGYILGSIPSAWLLCRIFYGIDIFEHGSRNMGATNVHRVLGTKPFAITLILDILKGFAAVLLSISFFSVPETAVPTGLAAGAAAIAGHSLSVWVKFRGGKGVATGLGVFLALAPKASVTAMGIFLLVLVSSGFVSLGSIAAACALPFLILEFRECGEAWLSSFVVFSAIAALFIVFRHKANIVRLWNGEENGLGSRKPEPEPPGATPAA
ncbi:MAG TPA: glycerol-3-phosphate 1-O-acyltransferase PlsY [Candidatus Ozemobacteraceae bacterium]|nr:glycerol-3-phosphate 1-O-acyltransferase PlsY [Candidatus Ozemobacteraceae bacterium]HQG29709.1 glycerol-3-phosphate 1-O-acyltransferase PlsY [Candidatus Ozemobacteraceae bacterium]